MIHVIRTNRSFPPTQLDWEVWTDTEVSSKDGRCIGAGKTRLEAIENAIKELEADLDQLKGPIRFGVEVNQK